VKTRSFIYAGNKFLINPSSNMKHKSASIIDDESHQNVSLYSLKIKL